MTACPVIFNMLDNAAPVPGTTLQAMMVCSTTNVAASQSVSLINTLTSVPFGPKFVPLMIVYPPAVVTWETDVILGPELIVSDYHFLRCFAISLPLYENSGAVVDCPPTSTTTSSPAPEPAAALHTMEDSVS